MKSLVLRLLAMSGIRASRVAVSVALGALTILFGVGLMATAGYLISRAAERPAIFSLEVAIVAVRFFGLTRPIARYFERLSSHDLALRVLGRVRLCVYERLEPLAPAKLEGYRRGDLLSRLVADVGALQNLYLRGVGPPLVALVAGAVSVGVAAALLPQAAIVLALGLVLGGIGVPAVSAVLSRRVTGTEVVARGEVAAELVELTGGAAELAVYGREDERLERLAGADSELVRAGRRAALADGAGDGLRLLVTGATVASVLAVAVTAHAGGDLDRVLVAAL